jgi:hypothetical protein
MPVAEDKPLTGKQRKFAAAVAEGKPKAQAYRENYAVTPGYEVAGRRRALETAAKPNVAAEIRRQVWLTCPPFDDIRGMKEHSVRVLSDLSRSAKSEEVRLKAALALFRIAETTRAAADPRATDREQDKLLDSLRKLYARVNGQVQEVDDAGDIDIGPTPLPPDDEPIDIQAIAISDTKS